MPGFLLNSAATAEALLEKFRHLDHDEDFHGDILIATAKAVDTAVRAQIGSGDTQELLLQGIPSDQLETHWPRLLQEVLEQYEFEKDIVQKNLSIAEDRPRTSFTVLPKHSGWEKVESDFVKELLSTHESQTRLGVRRMVWVPGKPGIKWGEVERPSENVHVLLPIQSGYRKTFQALTSISLDIGRSGIKKPLYIHVCVNFAEDNTLNEVLRFCKTIGSEIDGAVVIYVLEGKVDVGPGGKPWRWLKGLALNVILAEIDQWLRDSKLDRPNLDGHYLHFADDDVVLPNDRSAIKSNIDELYQNQKATVVSACYASSEDAGFSTLSSCWKRPKTLAAVGHDGHRLLNLYGGCMTTTAHRLRECLRIQDHKLAFPLNNEASSQEVTSEDVLLTVLANYQRLHGQQSPEGILPVGAYALASNLVYHPQPRNLGSFAHRFVRDDRFQHEALEIAHREIGGDRPNKEVFRAWRRSTFLPVGRQIQESIDPRLRLAACWLDRLRDRIRKTPRRFQDAGKFQPLDWVAHKTSHQICSDIVYDRGRFARLLDLVKREAFGFDFTRLMEASLDCRTKPFSKLSRLLVLRDHRDLRNYLSRNRYLFHWFYISEEAVAVTFQFLVTVEDQLEEAVSTLGLSTTRCKELASRYPIEAKQQIQEVLSQSLAAASRQDAPEATSEPPVLDPKDFTFEHSEFSSGPVDVAMSRRRRSYGRIVRVGQKKFLIRYYNILGRNAFQPDSPRRSVYLHKLGEALSTQVADSLRGFHDQGYARVVVPKTIFPSLEQATVNYAGPERRSPSERFLHSFYIQAALPRSGTAGSRGAHPLWKTKLREKSVEDVAISLANFLGFLHGLTLGFRLYLDERYINGSGEKSSDEICGPAATDINGVAETKREIFRLVIRHLDQVRFGQPVTFRTWLEKGAHRPGRVQALLGRVKERVPGVGSLVEALLVQDGPGLGELWSKTVEESAACQNRFGVVGHMVLRATNIYVESKNSDEDSWEDLYYSDQRLYGAKPCTRIAKIHLPIHHGLSMIDPALEAGLVLDELITARISSSAVHTANGKQDRNVDDKALLTDESFANVSTAFLERYSAALDNVVRPVKPGEKGTRSKSSPYLMKRAARLAQSESGIDIAGNTVLFQSLLQPRADIYLQTSLDEIVTRSCHWAAFGLLARYDNRREFNLSRADRQRLVRICVDLFHYGKGIKLQFRHA